MRQSQPPRALRIKWVLGPPDPPWNWRHRYSFDASGVLAFDPALIARTRRDMTTFAAEDRLIEERLCHLPHCPEWTNL